MLWACLYFPRLPVDRLARSHDAEESAPLAVIHQHGSRKLIMACNACAMQRGIEPGIALNSAYAIAPELHVHDYNEDEQQAHLNQLALWGLHFSSWVTPRMPTFMLMEIQASLKLFGGLDALLQQLHDGAQAQGLSVQVAVAPTTAAATLFAHAGYLEPVRTEKTMKYALAGIPVHYLSLDEFTLRSLRQSGIRNLQQLMNIPPPALTRRFGHQCTDIIYKLNGVLPDPCPAFTAPAQFAEAVDLPLEAPDTQALSFPLNRLLGALCGFLKACDNGVKVLEITLYHHRHKPTVLVLGFLDATASHAHLLKIGTERLANTVLPEPVTRLKIHASELASITRDGKDLFQKSRAQASSIEQVFDNLVARLGKNNIYTAMPDDDHRPEKAWMATLLETNKTPSVWPARPLWLLPEPKLAKESLSIETGAERIENGWWGDTDVRRDYFIARNNRGSYYWVFSIRCKPGQLFVHGIFA